MCKGVAGFGRREGCHSHPDYFQKKSASGRIRALSRRIDESQIHGGGTVFCGAVCRAVRSARGGGRTNPVWIFRGVFARGAAVGRKIQEIGRASGRERV